MFTFPVVTCLVFLFVISQKVLKKLINGYISCVYLLGVLIYYLPESVQETHQWLHFLCLLAWCSYVLSPRKCSRNSSMVTFPVFTCLVFLFIISQKVFKKLINGYISCGYLLGVLICYLPESLGVIIIIFF